MSHRTYRNTRLARRKAMRQARHGQSVSAGALRNCLAAAECVLFVTTPHASGPYTWLVAAPPRRIPCEIKGAMLLFEPGRMREAASTRAWVCRRGEPLPIAVKLPSARAMRLIAHAEDHGTPVIDLAAAFKNVARATP